METARVQYEIGRIQLACNRDAMAQQSFQKAAAHTDGEDVPWAYLAAQHLPGFDEQAWHGRLENALQHAMASSETHPLAVYHAAMLNLALHDVGKAKELFQQVFLLPDEMLSYHLARIAQQADTAPSPAL